MQEKENNQRKETNDREKQNRTKKANLDHFFGGLQNMGITEEMKKKKE